MVPQPRIWAKAWCSPTPTTMDELQHTATHMPPPTAMLTPPRLAPPMHMLPWYSLLYTSPPVQESIFPECY